MSVTAHKRSRAFSLIEFIVVMAIIITLSTSGAFILLYVVQSSTFIPNQMNMDMMAADAMNIMIEGDVQAKGLRFSRSINTIQPYQVIFQNQDGQTISYRMDTATDKLYRSIDGGAEALMPYYIPLSGVSLTGQSGKLFSYYDSNELITGIPANVGRIGITLTTMTGNGSFDQWQGRVDVASAVFVRAF